MTHSEKLIFTLSYGLVTLVFILILRNVVANKGTRYVFYILSSTTVPSAWGIILNPHRYTVTGWTAIGTFDFSLAAFTTAGAYHYCVVFNLLIAYTLLAKASVLKVKPAADQIAYRQRTVRKWKVEGEIVNLLFIALLTIVAATMFKYNIGVTGAAPEVLPYRLTGVVYYFSRCVMPALLLFYMAKWSVSSLGIILLLVSISFITLVTMSKYQVAALLFPVAYCLYVNKRYSILTFLVIASIPLMHLAANMRPTMFSISDGSATLIDRDLAFVFDSAYIEVKKIDFVTLISALSSRILSFQNTILAVQIKDIGDIPLVLFMPVIGSMSGYDGSMTTFLSHGFIPAEGFATGLDFVSFLIVVMIQSWPVFAVLCLFLSFLIRLNEYTVARSVLIPEDLRTVATFALTALMLFLPFFWWVFAFVLVAISGMMYFSSSRNREKR